MPLSLINRNNGNGRLDILRRGTGVGGLTLFTVGTGGAPELDADASAFITAAGITDETQKSAINTLVIDLKGYGIWTKMKAIYPFVGGTATTHKWNLKDPRDLDAAFRLQFFGGITHNELGAVGNGTNGYANTFLDHNGNVGRDDVHLSSYTNTISTVSGIPIGTFGANGGVNGFSFIAPGLTTNTTAEAQANGTTYDPERFTDTVKQGMYLVSRTLATEYTFYRNDAAMGTELNNSSAYTTTLNRSFYVFALNNTGAGLGAQYFSNARLAFASIGLGLNATDSANLYWAVDKYQRLLSRNV